MTQKFPSRYIAKGMKSLSQSDICISTFMQQYLQQPRYGNNLNFHQQIIVQRRYDVIVIYTKQCAYIYNYIYIKYMYDMM